MEKELKERFEALLDASVKKAAAADKPDSETIHLPHISVTPRGTDFGTVVEFVEAAIQEGTATLIRADKKDGVFDTMTALPQYNAVVHMLFTKEHYISVDIF